MSEVINCVSVFFAEMDDTEQIVFTFLSPMILLKLIQWREFASAPVTNFRHDFVFLS